MALVQHKGRAEQVNVVVCWRCLVQISAGMSAILTEVFYDFTWCLQASAGIVPQLG
jgi:hypothetical protein